MSLPANVLRRLLLVTDISQQLKKERDFLKWMARRHRDNPEQAAAFTTGAEMFEKFRQEILAGDFDAPAEKKEVFTDPAAELLSPAIQELVRRPKAPTPADPAVRRRVQELAGAIELEDALEKNSIRLAEAHRNAGKPGYTHNGHPKCRDAWCDYPIGHGGHHSHD